MRAYVQQVRPSDHIYLSMVEAAHWFGMRGYEVVHFTLDEVHDGKLDDDLLNHSEEIVVRGGVGTVRCLLKRAGRPAPPNLDLPDSLSKRIGRRIWHTTLGAVRSSIGTEDFEPLHIKPLLDQKLFKGTVIRSFRDLISTASLSSETPLLAQECVEFVSEWRASILRDRVLHVGHYRGDPLLLPDVDTIRDSVSEFAERPISFGMDWGITSDRKTLLVEVNDGFSLGNYGINGADYTAMIEARWRQLMGLSDNGVGEF